MFNKQKHLFITGLLIAFLSAGAFYTYRLFIGSNKTSAAQNQFIDEIENNVFTESSRINSTFGGNFVDMIRFLIKYNSKPTTIDKLHRNATEMKLE